MSKPTHKFVRVELDMYEKIIKISKSEDRSIQNVAKRLLRKGLENYKIEGK